MKTKISAISIIADEPSDVPSGAGVAAILAAGIGCATLGVFTVLGAAFKNTLGLLNLYEPTGPLSGVTTYTLIVWLAAWFVLARRWNGQHVAAARISALAFLLLALGFALTFPPITDWLVGELAGAPTV